MLEQQSILISSLASATQQNRGHQNDHLMPLLEGQQVVLEKLTIVESTQSEVTDLLSRFEEQQSDTVGELQSQIQAMHADRDGQADRVHHLELALAESAHDQASLRKEAGECRDNLEMVKSRNAALETHLQSLIKEKANTAREYEEDQTTRQREHMLYHQMEIDLQAKEEELTNEKGRNKTLAGTILSQSSELAELGRSTSKFHETLVDRLSRIEEGVQGSSDHSGEVSRLQKRNELLQEEVDSLKEKVRQSRNVH